MDRFFHLPAGNVLAICSYSLPGILSVEVGAQQKHKIYGKVSLAFIKIPPVRLLLRMRMLIQCHDLAKKRVQENISAICDVGRM